ncbi:sigma-70 family RNA polymerase sigma factor [Aquimarina sp. AD10]|uniref:RNA polymerase sigma factor n=1 Tax=Aquimarina aggregata TaxID=1642818 RepID=A0A162XQ26_9FLAO|nr:MULTISPECIES: sigma-70 family RNA polymerase sigma factor [Aquimarina]AXT60293.1 sigma-70 family RNA polymerase sigma factor [Aquimarina sp. AD10]KZS38730.1 RNA polymerase subunit sigma-70 [Aquimarina aggregata]RKN01272.1 sigma-70 family RNA polymerase sigma factor [Aquimarina sp. AD10]
MQPTALIIALQNKDQNAFKSIYDMYSENVYGIINTILKDDTLSEEVLQDVFIKIWNKAPLYSEKKGRFFTWILNIARNAAIDKTRSKSYKNTTQNLTVDSFVDILEDKTNFVSKIDSIGIKKYIQSLEPICKKVIDLLFFKGFTQKETAEELDIPLGTVKTRNRICIDKLKKTLEV